MNITTKSRKIYNELAQGWNTWDVYSVTAHVFLPTKLRLNVAFVVPHMTGYSGDSLWDNIESFGEHSVDGSYTEVCIRYLKGLFKIETSAREEELLIKITPLKSRYNCFVVLEVSQIWDGRLNIGYDNNKIRVESKNKVFTIDSLNKEAEISWNPSCFHNIVCKADQVTYFRVNSKKNNVEIDGTINKARHDWLDQTIQSNGKLGEGLTALRRSLLWNTVYDSRNQRVVTPVSRNWCKNRGNGLGDYVLFCWDTFFAALQFGLIDKKLAYANMFSILEEITEEGMVPNFGSANGKSRDRSEPQVGAICAWKLYLQFGEDWFIDECFDRLLAWNRWRFNERDLNGDGLLELASVPYEVPGNEEIWNRIECGTRQGAMWESGLDNSTMWDKAVFNEKKHCLELSYVGLNALMVADCECLEKMAKLLGREKERKELEKRRLKLKQKINEELWNKEIGCYLNKHWSGKFDSCLSLTHFYPITAGIVDEVKLDKLIDQHLLNQDEFWGDYILPNISRDDTSFEEQDYWRGRIWAPTNFLVGEGIMRIKKINIWDDFVRKGLDLFVKCWRERGVVGENYNAITGEAAEEGKASDRFYHWGALLVYMAVARIINFNEWEDEVEVFAVPEGLSKIKNLPLGNKKVSISESGEII